MIGFPCDLIELNQCDAKKADLPFAATVHFELQDGSSESETHHDMVEA